MGEVSKLWNAPLKNGGSANMAVNGSSTPVVFSYSPGNDLDVEIHSMCLIAEFTGTPAIGNKFLADAVGTLTNGLLLEAKDGDVSFSFGTLKRTRDLIEISTPQGGFNIISGTTSLVQIFIFIPPGMRLVKQGAFPNDDFVRATVRDDLRSISYLEMFLQGIKL
jgi:hypothetical protein